ncbi:Protein of unknown function (DUF1302) [gamma proteobacterium HdN1]|nr:Protein of unknown function (DUF1302) [gamma proteobacterium HdN1]
MSKRFHYRLTALAAALAGTGAALSLPAQALQVLQQGDLNVNVDTTLSVGAAFRASKVNYENIGRYNAAALQGIDASTLDVLNTAGDNFKKHKHGSSTYDDGDLRWRRDKPFSEMIKATIDMQADYKDYGAFVRGRAFYDNAIVKDEGGTMTPPYYSADANGQPIGPAQKIGRRAKILDAFVYGNWSLGGKALNVRAGQQVVNWGEGVLFANGINTINPVDVAALLAPGAEVKEALIPVKMLYGSLSLSDALSVEAFYQFQWKKTVVPDCSTFFSTIDVVGDHCASGYMPFGMELNAPVSTAGGLIKLNPAEFNVRYAKDSEPDNGGEYGLAMRYYVDAIQTEFGAYYINYHSRLPILSGYAPTLAAMQNSNILNAIGTRLSTAQISLEYPEDIHLFGASFNTNLNLGLPGGESAVAGEISLRKNQPFQVEDSVLVTGLLGAPSQICVTKDNPYGLCYNSYMPDEFISGGIRKDFYQAEVSLIHFFDQLLGADRWTVLVDMAYNYADIPDKGELLLNSGYNADIRPAWSSLLSPADSINLPGASALMGGGVDPVVQTLNNMLYTSKSATQESRYYPTRSSWGYKLRISGEYSNVFAGINLTPTFSFSHDVNGVTPGPVSNFLEHRKAAGFSLEGVYLNMYKMEVAYTNFFGAEPYNQLNDRDYYSISAAVSF